MLRGLNYQMNAVAWSHPEEPNNPRILAINVREGSQLFPVTYTYFPKERTLFRNSHVGVSRLASGDVESFSVSPVFEFLTDPAHPGSTAELVRVFYEVHFSLHSPDAGSKIAKRSLSFTTRVTPKYLNSVIKSRWGP